MGLGTSLVLCIFKGVDVKASDNNQIRDKCCISKAVQRMQGRHSKGVIVPHTKKPRDVGRLGHHDFQLGLYFCVMTNHVDPYMYKG